MSGARRVGVFAIVGVACTHQSSPPSPTIVTPTPVGESGDRSKPPPRALEAPPICDEGFEPSTCPEGYERATRWQEIAPCLRIAYPSVSDHTSIAELRNRALAKVDGYWECLRRGPEVSLPSATTTLRFEVTPDGKSRNVTVVSSELASETTECIKNVTESIEWPKTELGLSQVVLPVLIRTKKTVEDPNASCQPVE